MHEGHGSRGGEILLTKRPRFGPKQVRSLKGLRVGTKLRQCCKASGTVEKILVEVTGEPYQSILSLRVSCRTSLDGGKTWHEGGYLSLGDMNVVPYTHNGKWNPSNWLERL